MRGGRCNIFKGGGRRLTLGAFKSSNEDAVRKSSLQGETRKKEGTKKGRGPGGKGEELEVRCSCIEESAGLKSDT